MKHFKKKHIFFFYNLESDKLNQAPRTTQNTLGIQQN